MPIRDGKLPARLRSAAGHMGKARDKMLMLCAADEVESVRARNNELAKRCIAAEAKLARVKEHVHNNFLADEEDWGRLDTILSDTKEAD